MRLVKEGSKPKAAKFFQLTRKEARLAEIINKNVFLHCMNASKTEGAKDAVAKAFMKINNANAEKAVENYIEELNSNDPHIYENASLALVNMWRQSMKPLCMVLVDREKPTNARLMAAITFKRMAKKDILGDGMVEALLRVQKAPDSGLVLRAAAGLALEAIARVFMKDKKPQVKACGTLLYEIAIREDPVKVCESWVKNEKNKVMRDEFREVLRLLTADEKV